MHLQGQRFARVQNFYQQRKASLPRARGPKQFRRVMCHQPAQVFPRQRTVGDDAHIPGPVADLPRFANGPFRWQRFAVKPFQIAPAPDAFFENRLKGQRIEHGADSLCKVMIRLLASA